MMDQVTPTQLCHYPNSLWLHALSIDIIAPSVIPLSPNEHQLVVPWKQVNPSVASAGLFKYHQTNTFNVPENINRFITESRNLMIMYVHRYPKLDCKTPFLPSITHNIHADTHCIGLRHVKDELNASHLDLAACFIEQGHDVLVIFDHVKSFGYHAIEHCENFMAYAALSGARSSITEHSATQLGTTDQPDFSAWCHQFNHTRYPSLIEKQVCNA
ncbi:hypothetical protein AB6C54_18470 [Vibrio splendidus]